MCIGHGGHNGCRLVRFGYDSGHARETPQRGIHWDVKDGKITRFQQYADTAKLQDVMGV